MRKDVARNRARLLEAADRLFAERGREAGLDDVARAAGVGVATAYRHFATKAALLDALIDDRVAHAAALLEEAEREPDPVAALIGVLLRIGEGQAADRGLREAMEAAGADQSVADRFRAAVGPAIRRLAERAAATGRVEPSFADGDIVVMIWMMGTISQQTGHQSPDLWRRCLGFLLNGVLTEPTAALGELPPPLDPRTFEAQPATPYP